jgi:4-amino-4-deoxy-L-arabinose transferase-like glycosyltransferase
MLPLFALFAAWAWTQARMRRKSLFWLAALSGLMVSLAWIYMGGAHYFTNVGAKFGIYAANSATVTKTSRL